MRPLIAIVSCHRYRSRAEAQRATWLRDFPEGLDYRFFLGRGPEGYEPKPDEVVLDVADDYVSLIAKVKAIYRWALERGYTAVFKTDDDVYVRPERLLAADIGAHDYVGRLRGPSGGFPAAYASGLGYWLSRRAMETLVGAEQGKHLAEDRWVGNALYAAGILCRADYRYAVIRSSRNAVSAWEGPRKGNELIAVCEFNTEEMARIHREFSTLTSSERRPKANGPLSNVCVLIKTFLRDGFLHRCVEGIRQSLPECRIIVADDGLESAKKITWYARLREEGHTCLWLPFDSGFGEKANAAIPYMNREYVLIGSDDFDFARPGVRDGVIRLATVLDHDRSIALASGRVNNRPYESMLEIGPDWVRERKEIGERRVARGVAYHVCDLTVNYSLIRTSIFRAEPGGVRWDGGAVKIGGGEHGAFFLDLKRAGLGVAYVPEVSVTEFPFDPTMVNPGYSEARGRARQQGRPCLVRRGIKYWQLMNGGWEKS